MDFLEIIQVRQILQLILLDDFTVTFQNIVFGLAFIEFVPFFLTIQGISKPLPSTAFRSLRSVHAGVSLSQTNYWLLILSLNERFVLQHLVRLLFLLGEVDTLLTLAVRLLRSVRVVILLVELHLLLIVLPGSVLFLIVGHVWDLGRQLLLVLGRGPQLWPALILLREGSRRLQGVTARLLLVVAVAAILLTASLGGVLF